MEFAIFFLRDGAVRPVRAGAEFDGVNRVQRQAGRLRQLPSQGGFAPAGIAEYRDPLQEWPVIDIERQVAFE